MAEFQKEAKHVAYNTRPNQLQKSRDIVNLWDQQKKK